MKLTNIHGIPDTIVRAVDKRNEEYNRGNVHRSATQLINSPRIDLLRKKRFGEIEIDASQEFWPLLGTAVHHILEMGRAENQILEERLYAEFDGWTLSGALDVQELNDGKITISDYKVCTLFALRQNDGDGKFEWTAQQNIYRWLVEKAKGIPVEALFIVAIVRDWQNSGKLRDPLYPPSPILKIPVEMWSMEQTEAYLHDRINEHRRAEMLDGFEGVLPYCSAEERWERGRVFKIKKKGGVRAVKIFDTLEEAEAYLTTLAPGYSIQLEEGSNVRCENNYCQVAEFCDQFKEIQAAKAGVLR